jgi:solute:Na+ symporter, SSS family
MHALTIISFLLFTGLVGLITWLITRKDDHGTQVITNLIFLVAYAVILLPIILYTGAVGMIEILDLKSMLNMQSDATMLWIIVWMVGIIGSMYALWEGLHSVAVSDTLNGVGLLTGGFLITFFALQALGGDEGVAAGITKLTELAPGKLN